MEIGFENGFPTFRGSWPWPWIGSYCIPSCITHQPLPTCQISLKSNKLFVDGRTYGRTDGWTFETHFYYVDSEKKLVLARRNIKTIRFIEQKIQWLQVHYLTLNWLFWKPKTACIRNFCLRLTIKAQDQMPGQWANGKPSFDRTAGCN